MAEQTPIAVGIPTAAQLLDRRPSTIRHLIRTRQLPAAKVGRAWLIRVSDLEEAVSTRVEEAVSTRVEEVISTRAEETRAGGAR